MNPITHTPHALLKYFAMLAIGLLSVSASAQTITPVGVQPAFFIPSNPTSDDFVRARLETRFCSIFANTILDFPTTPVNGVITIQALGLYSFDLAFCVYGINTTVFNLGRLPSGTFRVEFRMRSPVDEPLGLGALVQVSTLTVLPSQALVTQVPTLQNRSLGAFAVLALLLGIVAIRRQS